MGHEATKQFWKSSHFENMTAVFLLRCQNSLRQISPEKSPFQAWINKDFNQHLVVTFDSINNFTHQAPQNDRLNLSFVKDIHSVAKKWPQIVEKWPFLKLKFSGFFSPKIENRVVKTNCDLYGSFWSNKDLDMLGISKWSSEPQFYERYKCSWWKDGQL